MPSGRQRQKPITRKELLRLGMLRRRNDLEVVESAKWLGELTSSRLSGPGIRIDYLYYYKVAVLRNVGMLSTNDTLTTAKVRV